MHSRRLQSAVTNSVHGQLFAVQPVLAAGAAVEPVLATGAEESGCTTAACL